jgi:putative methylase
MREASMGPPVGALQYGPTGRRSPELRRILGEVPDLPRPEPSWEQVSTPARQAVDLLWTAWTRGDIAGRRVLDLGSGTGRLSLGAALLGARSVVGLEVDPSAIAIAEREARRHGVSVTYVHADVRTARLIRADTVVMNPPFGAQKRHADLPFLEYATRAARPGGGLYLYFNAPAQAFLEGWALAHELAIEEHRRGHWDLPPIFPHHRKWRERIEVDFWILRKRGRS